MTESDLAKLLSSNPDLGIIGPMNDNALSLVARALVAPQGKLSEHDMQRLIIAECDLRANQDPRWGYIMAIPNGQYRKGQRMEPGLRAGVPDLFLPVAMYGYHGLWIELKVGRNKQTEAQARWYVDLLNLGYQVTVVRDDADEAIARIALYLEGLL